jgi:hypothetical protein
MPKKDKLLFIISFICLLCFYYFLALSGLHQYMVLATFLICSFFFFFKKKLLIILYKVLLPTMESFIQKAICWVS